MLIAGAGGHAIELLELFEQGHFNGPIAFFDDVTAYMPDKIFGIYPILRSIDAATDFLRKFPEFVLGTGDPNARKILDEKLSGVGGKLGSIVSPLASVGKYDVFLGEGLNIMTGAVITGRVSIGRGSLIHVLASVHHDTVIGEYCEVSPGSRVLGHAKVGSFVSIGANAVILPRVRVGDHAVIGAGAVVNKDVPHGITVAGVPAKAIR